MFENKYEKINLIARGGMAEVFKARKKGAAGFEKLVAIKRLHPHLSEDEEMVAMLKDEANLVSNMVHPNICQVLNFEKLDGSYCMVMEYIHGHALSSIARKARKNNTKIPIDIALYIIREALNGLDYAHRMTDPLTGQTLNIIHRDISPQNIMVTYSGGVKVIDFGIAKAAASIHHTQSGVIKGKFRYMAPEQARGKELDYRVDIFAIGVVLYELILGHNHSPGATDVELMVKAQAAKFEHIGKLVPVLPAGLDLAIMKALNPDRDQRFPSARMFRRALDTIVQRENMNISPDALADYIKTLFPDMHSAGSMVDVIERSSRDNLSNYSQPITESGSVSDIKRQRRSHHSRRHSAVPVVPIPPPSSTANPPLSPPSQTTEPPPPPILPDVQPKGKTASTNLSARAKRRLERQRKKEEKARKQQQQQEENAKIIREKTEKIKIKKPPVILPFISRVLVAISHILVNLFYLVLVLGIILGLWVYTRSPNPNSSDKTKSNSTQNKKSKCAMGPVELTILSRPSGAEVFLDGEDIYQTTPLYNAQTEMCYNKPMLITLKKGNLSVNAKVDYPLKSKRLKIKLKLTSEGKIIQYKPKSNSSSSSFRSSGSSRNHKKTKTVLQNTDKKAAPPLSKDIIPVGNLKVTCSKVCNIVIDGKNKGIRKFFLLRARKRPYKVQAFFTDGTKSAVKKVYILRNQTQYEHFTPSG